MGCLPTPYHRAYFVWSGRVLPVLDTLIAHVSAGNNLDLAQFGLSEKDFKKAIDIGYFTDEELVLLDNAIRCA